MASALPAPGSPDVLYLVDLSSHLFRAYHAVVPLHSPSGEPTHAVFGLITMLERLFREQSPKLVAIAMDTGRATFRKELYDPYKANRPPAPPDLKSQMERAEEIVRGLGYPVFKQDGVEADDLIATLTRFAERNGLRVVVVGADKDLMQLVTERVLLWDTMRNKVLGPAEVEERFGVPPSMLGDLLALMGDTSDNIPGVPSVGPKTAAKLLLEHKDLEGVLRDGPAQATKKLKEALVEHAESARLSRRLVALREDCPIEVSVEGLRAGLGAGKNLAAMVQLYETLGFMKQLPALRALLAAEGPVSPAAVSDAAPRPAAPAALAVPATTLSDIPQAEVVSSLQEWREIVCSTKGPTVALEWLTWSPEAHRGQPVGLMLTTEQGGYYVPIAHRYVGAPTQLKLEEVIEVLEVAPWERAFVFDLKRQCVLLGPVLPGTAGLTVADDVLLASYLVNPEARHTLEALAAEQSETLGEFAEIAREGRLLRGADELAVEVVAGWAFARGRALLKVGPIVIQRLEDSGLRDLYREVELPLARQLAELQTLGVLVDAAGLRSLGADCDAELKRIEAQAVEIVGHEFNVQSPRQLETILFDELGLKPLKRTKTARSTDAETLDALAEEHPLPAVILEHRQIAKLKGTYIDTLPTLVDPRTGRVHGSWEQAVAATGRISSIDPNLQNIPIKSQLGRKIRSTFVAPPGHRIVSCDYSQIELRVLAHMSEDPRLIEAFQTGQDVHLRTAMEVFEVPESEVTREMRARAKAVNFGVIYGQGEFALAKALKIERRVAADFIATYFRRYEGVRRYLDETLERARRGEPVQSILGRRRILPDLQSSNRSRRLAAERIATNLPIQGSAADILKLAMLALREPVTPGARLVLTVHDELVFEVPLAEVEVAKREIAAKMAGAYALRVPLEVSAGDGPNWNEAH